MVCVCFTIVVMGMVVLGAGVGLSSVEHKQLSNSGFKQTVRFSSWLNGWVLKITRVTPAPSMATPITTTAKQTHTNTLL